MSHKTPLASEAKDPQESRPAFANRAAQAAARVAERFAHAPSYGEMLADEARAAVRAAEAASQAALEAHAAVQYVLAGLEAATSPESDWEPKAAPYRLPERDSALRVTSAQEDLPEPLLGHESSLFDGCPEPQQSTLRPKAAPARVSPRRQRPGIAKARAEDGHELASLTPVARGIDDGHAGEAAQPIHANLIQFPREMVATRKMRPRRAEGPLADAAREAQLSIFEVDPRSISTQPATAVDEPATPAWMRTKLPSIELEPQTEEDRREEPTPQAPTPAPVELAPMSRRLLALVVDTTLIVAAFLAVTMLVVANAQELPGPRAIELGAALAVVAIGAAYQTLFLTLARATPGMKYAGIGLSTFEGDSPSRAQRCGRLMVLPLSVLPIGLGLLWALFDDSHLAWHDRLSRTYLRKQ